MLAKIKDFVNNRDQRSWSKVKMKVRTFIDQYLSDIILLIGVILISLLSFAVGYIVAKQQDKEPIKVERGGDEVPSSSPSLSHYESLVYEDNSISCRFVPGWQPPLG